MMQKIYTKLFLLKRFRCIKSNNAIIINIANGWYARYIEKSNLIKEIKALVVPQKRHLYPVIYLIRQVVLNTNNIQ